MPQISPHAIVECPANLAEDVVVGPFARIGPEVRIGPGVRVDNNVTINGLVEIGRDNHVYPFAIIGQDGGDGGPIVIGQSNRIREHVVISSAPVGGRTVIGDRNLIMVGCCVEAGASIAHDAILGNYTHLAEGARVESFVHTGGFTALEPRCTVGAYTFTSGYAGINRDTPPFATVQGFPFRIRGVNVVKLRRCGLAEETINALKDAFRELFNGETSETQIDAGRVGQFAASAGDDEHLQALHRYLDRVLSANRKGGE